MKILLTNAKVRISRNNFSHSIGFDSATGRIIFTGNKIESGKVKSSFDEITDCAGKLVLPSFYEGHCHFAEGAYVNSLLDLRQTATKNDFIKSIREYSKFPGVSFIAGGFFAESNFKEDIDLNKEFLDSICNDIPVVISRFDTHSAIANSKAIELSGLISKETEFTSDEIIRSGGKYTGELKERARDFVLSSLPRPDIQRRFKVANDLMERFNSFGITSISDITLVSDLEVFKEFINTDNLTLDVDARLNISEYKNIEKYKKEFEGYENRIKFKSFKAFYDGSLSSKTAYMHSDYKGLSHNGIQTDIVLNREFHRACAEIDKNGYQLSVHAIGDKAVTELLDFNEYLIRTNGTKDRRFRIEHAQHISERDFDRFRDLKVIASVQPSHLFSDARTAETILDDPSLEHNYDRLFKNGSTVCFGTDFPIVSENPFETIYFAMTRKAEGFENGFYREKCISLDDCIDAYTINNAFAAYSEEIKGTLEPGKDADLIILNEDLYETKHDDIRNCSVKTTYFKGKEIYSC